MVFSCQKSLMSEALSNVSRVIATKSSIPYLEGVQIKAYGNEISLAGYDMEAGITTNIPADISVEGEIVLSARLLLDMLRKIRSDEVSVCVLDKYLTEIKGGITEFTILGSPSEEFPELPTVSDGKALTIDQAILKSMIDQTLFSIATNDAKPVHMGSLFDIEDNTMTIVSVDGYRLAMRKERVSFDGAIKFVVPSKALSEIAKLLKDDGEEKVSLVVSKKHIVFQIGSYSVISRLLEGEFLDYKNSIPEGYKSCANVSRRMFIDCVESASLLITDRLRSPLRVIFEEEKIKVHCSSPLGKAYDEIDCKMSGEGNEMGFNNKYLLDALKAADTDEVKVLISGPISPIKILPPQGEHFLFLVLPVRLKNEN